jgi:hypothetical protein
MDRDDLLSHALAGTYHRAYALATELAGSELAPLVRGDCTDRARDWVIEAIVSQVLRRLDGPDDDDLGLVFLAVGDAIEQKRAASCSAVGTGWGGSGEEEEDREQE